MVLGAMLVAVQTRLRITAGRPLGNDYAAQPPILFALMAVVVLGVVGFTGRWPQTKQRRFGTLALALVLIIGMTVLVLPDVSILQLVYFAGFGSAIGVMTILLPPTPSLRGKPTSLFYHLGKLWESRMLLRLWVSYNIRSRYSQTVLGIAWIVLLPLSTSTILALVFSQIVRIEQPDNTPYITYFFTAMVAWQWFSQGMINGTGSLLRELTLMKQVYFPREIVVIVKMGEAIIDFVFTFSIMLLINALVGVWPNANFIYLPILFVIQLCFTLGLMFFLSYITVMIRDIPQLVAVGLQLLFYLTPIIYSVNNIPERLRFLVLINPLALLIDAYRAIVVYNMPPDPINLYYPAVIAGVLLYSGYLFFKANERRITDFV